MPDKNFLEAKIAGIIFQQCFGRSNIWRSREQNKEGCQLAAKEILKLIRQTKSRRILNAMRGYHDVAEFYQEDEGSEAAE